eukprot:351026-Chlamydomonas_euryale.AAC.4
MGEGSRRGNGRCARPGSKWGDRDGRGGQEREEVRKARKGGGQWGRGEGNKGDELRQRAQGCGWSCSADVTDPTPTKSHTHTTSHKPTPTPHPS